MAGTRCYSSLHSPVAEQQLASAWAWLDILYIYWLYLLVTGYPAHAEENHGGSSTVHRNYLGVRTKLFIQIQMFAATSLMGTFIIHVIKE